MLLKLIQISLLFQGSLAISSHYFLSNQLILGSSSQDDYPQCPIDIPLTCSNATPIENSCCFESPGGIFLQTQFWDYYPPIGPEDSFTLHGLWPDNCDGTYEQFCNDGQNIDKVSKIILDEFNDEILYSKMQKNWKNFNGDDESLWIHEFNKHATCIKTLKPNCYSDFIKDRNVYDFFNITLNIYEKLPTFAFLESEGIVPSASVTYTKKQISDALSKNFHGHKVYFKCNKYNALQEIWYYHYLHGSIRQEEFKPIPSLLESGCPEEGIKYLPKSGWKPPSAPRPPSSPNNGHIKLPGHPGCLISNGQWYQYGTCATYQITKSQFGGYNLKSSKGYCGVSNDGELACNRLNQPSKSQFQFNKETGEIGYGGNFKWCFDYKKSHGHGKYIQVPITLDKGNCEESFNLNFN